MSLAFVLGAGLLASPSNSITHADYLVERIKYPVATPLQDQPLVSQFTALADKVIEIEGVVSGIVVSGTTQAGKYSGYQLKLGDDQVVTVAGEANNPNIAVSDKLRILARVPVRGTVLTEVAGVRMGQLNSPTVESASSSSGSMLDQQFTKAIPPKDFLAQAKEAAPQPAAAVTKTVAATSKPAVKKAAAQPKPAVVSNQAQMYAKKILQVNGKIGTSTATKIAEVVLKKSKQYGVDPRLVFAMLAQESRFNPKAVSHTGAQGLGQLMPGTARMLGVKNSFDIEQNVDGSVRYLSQQMRAFGGDFRRALAAYNAGPGNVQRYGGIPPFRETQHYVRTITSHYRQLQNSLL
jgi:soluble lytic murein transglycosylase-like protein